MTSLPLKAIFSIEEFKNAESLEKERSALLQPSRDVMDSKLGQPKFDQLPAYVYVYKIAFGAGGQLVVDHMLHYTEGSSGKPADRPRIEHKDVPSVVQGLLNGSVASRNPANDLGANFKHEGHHWDRLCYIAFVIDHPNWSFCDLTSNPDLPPAVFRRIKNNRPTETNTCFFDGAVVPISVGGEERKLFYCINHFRDKDGKRPSKPKHEQFKYDLYTKFDFGAGFPEAILIFDPGGDNNGPPVPPPEDD
jgi:hypothetical protein|tara:strand:- start:603 stop:1349 length:747 start_codon:yes stop_codon:yes gene_type:complete